MDEPTNADLQDSFNLHAKEDHKFQEETRLYNEEMAIFKAETEGSFALMHEKLDLILRQQTSIDNKFDPHHPDYAFIKMDLMFDVYEGLGFSTRMLMKVAAVVGSLTVIFGGVFAAVRFIK